MRTASPAAVTRAIIRTVVLFTVFIPRPCCDVPQAVTHRAAIGCCWPATTRDSSTTASAAASAMLRPQAAFCMRRSVRQGKQQHCAEKTNGPIIAHLEKEPGYAHRTRGGGGRDRH